VIVPRRLRADWRQEWETELQYREWQLADWDRLDWRNRLDLLRRSSSAFWDALLLQPRRLEDEVFQDLRYGVRMLTTHPGFTAVAVLTLALGIGANTAIFSVANAVWLRALPYPSAEQLVLVSHRTQQGSTVELTPASYLDLRRQNRSFEDLAVYSSHDFNLTGAGEPDRLRGQLVSAALFTVLRTAPGIGRSFTDSDDRAGAPRVVILGHGVWQRRFGARADVIGRTLTLDDQPCEVVGIMPPGFDFPTKGTEVWAPIAFSASASNERSSWYLSGIARLNAGVTPAAAQRELDIIARNIAQASPRTNANIGLSLVSLHESLVTNFKPALLVLLGAVAFVLLIACVNVANLLLARGAERERELALRSALGADRWRLLRQLSTESGLLAFSGGALGLLLAVWGIGALKQIDPGTVARLDQVGLDPRVLAFTLAISCLTGLIFGLAPALHVSNPDLQQTLKDSGHGSGGVRGRRLRSMLVIAEVALSLVLLVGAGLLIRSFIRLQKIDLGFNPESLLALRIEVSEARADLTSISTFYQQVLDRVQGVPGVRAAAIVTAAPIQTIGMRSALVIEDKPDPRPGEPPMLANNRVVSPDYFRTLGIQLLRGRLLSAQDNARAPFVVVINQAFAQRYWGNEDPIGKRLKLTYRQSTLPWLTVVGLVGSVRQDGLKEPFPEFYTPFTQAHPRWVRPSVLFIRADGNPLTLIEAVKSQVWAVNKDQTITAVQTMDEILARWLAPRRFNMWLLGVFASLALLLAAVGIYGVISYAVSQRTREIGIRLALGAEARDVLRMVVAQGMSLTLVGVAIGLVAAAALTRVMKDLLFGVSPTDPVTFALIALLLVVVALFACYLPARRSAGTDPLAAIRCE
jgi:putative ABC transport system permease protein